MNKIGIKKNMAKKKIIKENIQALDSIRIGLKENFYQSLIELFTEVANDHGYDEGSCEDYIEDYAEWQSNELANDCIKVIKSNDWDVPQHNFRPFGYVMQSEYGIRTVEDLLNHENPVEIIIDWFWDCFGTFGIKYNFGNSLDEYMYDYEQENVEELNEYKNVKKINESQLRKMIKESIVNLLNERKPSDRTIGSHSFKGLRYDKNGNPLYTSDTLSDEQKKEQGWKYSKKHGLHGQISDPTKINENQLRKIIKESVEKILNNIK